MDDDFAAGYMPAANYYTLRVLPLVSSLPVTKGKWRKLCIRGMCLTCIASCAIPGLKPQSSPQSKTETYYVSSQNSSYLEYLIFAHEQATD